MQIVISKAAGRTLRRSDKRELIARKIEELTVDRDALAANVVKLQGRSGYRLRAQNWRIVFRLADDVLYIDEIEPRGSAYEDRT
ncbi:MAG: type II toxin-antitoxin system RelE family toxin [Burkholderiales bacterium]